jgi:DNA recombination protein RmuC
MSISPAVPGAIAGLAAGAALTWLVAALRHRAAAAALTARLEEREARLARLERDVSELAGARERAAGLAASLEAERGAAAERVALLERAEGRLREAFQAASAEALRQNAEQFLHLAGTSFEARQRAIGELVQPIRETLAKVDGKLHQVELARVGSYEALLEQVRAMAETQRELSTRTKGLADALRSPNVRGRWGEIQLRRVCEMAGMVDHCDFVEQATVDAADGRLRPDLLVRLPGGKVIVVDAKAPLQAYLDAVDAPDEATREARLRDHARHVRDHVTRLSAKAYWGQFEESPEFVVMFLPGETFFSAALQHEPGLIEYGVEQRVIPASPTTLIALLRSVAYGWQQDRVARNAEEISALGRELHDRIRTFAGHHAELRRGLERAVEAYNRSVGSLERSVLPQARRFRALGATSAAELPPAEAIDLALRAFAAEELAGAPPAPALPPA